MRGLCVACRTLPTPADGSSESCQRSAPSNSETVLPQTGPKVRFRSASAVRTKPKRDHSTASVRIAFSVEPVRRRTARDWNSSEFQNDVA